MEEIRSIDDMRIWRRNLERGVKVAFVPTMGALHEGHLALIQRAKAEGDRVVVSIFVNPTQFDDEGDLAAYPQPEAEDLAACTKAGVDCVFLPQVAEFYPDGYCTFVEVIGPMNERLCAATRPGHFRGVATVVTKLFHIVEPDVAVFGEKDLQQALILQRMISDLHMPVRMVVAETVRDTDGLALSSRNRRLGDLARTKAQGLPRGLERANRLFKDGTRESLKLIEQVYNELLVHPGVDVDYAEVVRIRGFTDAETAEPGDMLAAAAVVDGVRLIDHVLLGGPSLPVDIEG